MMRIRNVILVLLLLFFASCSSLPLDVFAIRAGASIEEMKSSVLRSPDKVRHFVREGKSYESWTYIKENIVVLFQDGIISEWHN